MRTRARRAAVAALALLALAACRPGEPAATGAAAAARCDGAFRLVNASASTVTRFHFSPAEVDDWGLNRIRRGGLPPRHLDYFQTTRAGPYDFVAIFPGGQGVELRNVDVCRTPQINVFDRQMIAS